MSNIDRESVEKVIIACGGSDDTDRPVLERIVLQEVIGVRPKRPDTPMEAAFRGRVRIEVSRTKGTL